MKVLHVIPSVARRYGGPSTVIFPMVERLRFLGMDTWVISTDADGDSRVQLADFGHVENLRLFRVNISKTWKLSLPLIFWLWKNVKNFDLVHIHCVWSSSTFSAAMISKLQNIPYILRPAGMLSEYSWQHKGWKKRIYWNLFEKYTIRCASAFHATSQIESTDIKRLKPTAQVYIIPNGVESNAFSFPESDSRKDKDGNIQLLFLSRLHPKKGICDRLIPAMSKLKKNVQLKIVGGEDEHYPGHTAEINQCISSFDLHERIKILGPVNGDDRWKLFDEADIFILPSHSENFGVVVGEAMARGCPSIITKEVQSYPLVEEANGGLVVDGGANELAVAINKLSEDIILRKKMALSAKTFASEKLAWSSIAQDIIAMYRSVI